MNETPPVLRPTGTVTFLFSDIEGSTERWERHRDAMQDALRLHDAILRAAIERHGGFVFKTMGDAFCAVFHTVAEAIAAALETQRGIAAQEWAQVGGLRVRIAIHTGVTDERDGDYFGPTVNRVARLLGVANGDQVVLSGVAADLAQGIMPARTSLRDLGAHRLKDLANPEQVYQLVAPDLRSDFPPLRSLDALPHNLPLQITTFVGRDDAIADIKALIARARVVTLVGTGGVGKTRTSLQVAADLLDGYPDGVWFVEFAPLAEPSLVATSISSAVGVAPSADLTPWTALLGHLKSRRLLLVLDNCEHVVEEVARVADGIVRAAPHVTILATSREALNVAGEHVYRMPSLSVPPLDAKLDAAEAMTFGAISLFVERANAADARFHLDDENATAVAEICRRLDGIALAIELAAPRVKVLSAQQLSQRLDERFRLLTGGSRAALPRQQTMRALIDWSYDLLSENEKTIFRRVSIFAGGWTIDAASEICSDDAIESWDVLDVLSTLVDKSLIAAELQGSHQRYRLLESMRQYARERLSGSTDAASVARRHGECFLTMGMRAESERTSADERGWLERFGPEIDNFRLAFTWAVEERNEFAKGVAMAANLFRVFDRLSLQDEGLQWYDTVLSAGESLSTLDEAKLEHARAFLLANLARFTQARSAFERSIKMFREAPDGPGYTEALLGAVRVYAISQREDEALEIAAEALERARASNDRLMLARALQMSAAAVEDVDRARAMYAESVTLFRALGHEVERANALVWYAEYESKIGNHPGARRITCEALETPGIRVSSRALMKSNLVGYDLAVDESSVPRETIQEALDLAIASRIRDLVANVVLYAGMVVCVAGNIHEAARFLGYSDATMRALDAHLGPTEQVPRNRLLARLSDALGTDELTKLMNEGGEWTEEQAVAAVRRM